MIMSRFKSVVRVHIIQSSHVADRDRGSSASSKVRSACPEQERTFGPLVVSASVCEKGCHTAIQNRNSVHHSLKTENQSIGTSTTRPVYSAQLVDSEFVAWILIGDAKTGSKLCKTGPVRTRKNMSSSFGKQTSMFLS